MLDQPKRGRILRQGQMGSDFVGCCRFRGHRVRCDYGTGGGLWDGGVLRESSSSRLSG